MTVARAFCLGTLILFQSEAAMADCTPEQFQAWFREAVQGAPRMSRAVERRAAQFRYAFVGGFANERMPGYFSQCVQELKAHGVPSAQIHFIFPSSHETFEGNSDEVRSRFLEIASQGPERLVVIAHSRGACDALAFALQNAPFVRDRVQALFLVQGAFGGTGAADYLMGEGLSMDHQMPIKLRVLAFVLGKLESFVLHRGKHGGLADLTRSESDRFWQQMMLDHAEAIPIVGPKTFYVTSQIQPSQLRLFRRAIASYLQTYYGPNDGMVLLRDQSLPGLGTCLAVLEASHTDLTHRQPSARTPRRFRHALIVSILNALGTSDADPGKVPVPRFPRLRRRVDEKSNL